ncbi:TRZ/ATZ family hydrolase [Plasticicumulans acidivorans]|uniref:5-methylthioadenosine/S-adenosylhomocysteine deaminase n=1 Tax=Plasticicumulans acidivorans TaxID=886464 RepID=A0A317MSE8_9GAMM|nr:TRZ/ATZ family hydrolase [Plasticicumulans acidivorans]PWV59480.1 5-methylthioadenosine/S-adenosylhomocysteine deaminase [Plasticicumulans acidivorans]
MQTIDTLIFPRWIVPVEPEGTVLEGIALAIDQGRILDLLPADVAPLRYAARQSLQLPTHCLLPGLVNAHTHLAMNLLRGFADDLPLMRWLQEHIWPTEARWVSESFVHDGTQLAAAELIRGGVTCVNDMYFFPDVSARALAAAGLRASIGMIVIEFPSAWATDAEDYLAKGLVLRESLRHDPLLSFCFAPHAPYTVSAATLTRIRALADELDAPIHMHVHETAGEITQFEQAHGCRPLQQLDRLGLLSPALMAVHMTQLDDAEIARLADTGVSVVHCPESNLKLASGFCPTARLDAAGVNVALGTDGAASNNDLDMFSEMRSAALLAKAVANDASAVPAHQALRMATLNGARAIGLGAQTGSLVPGKWADVIAVDLGDLESQPLFNPISQIVYASGRHQVSDVWVGGRQLLRHRELTTLDREMLLARAEHWRTQIATAH